MSSLFQTNPLVSKATTKTVFDSFVLLFLTIFTKPPYSAEHFAFLQFKDSRTGLVQIFFKNCDSLWLAKKLTESLWLSVKNSCPDCIKEIDSSLKKIPPAFEGIYQKKPTLFPYLSSKWDMNYLAHFTLADTKILADLPTGPRQLFCPVSIGSGSPGKLFLLDAGFLDCRVLP
ncbi:MAG: hypothetical protein LC660_07455 [Desulfobacteraceae bacterium]|nr:hypothetical protein [Desulfobacteraceae bacterium]